MKEFLKRVLLFVIFFSLTSLFLPVYAKDKVKMIVTMHNDVSVENLSSEVLFKTLKKMTINGITIPQRSVVSAEMIQNQRERRWHKSGYIICKLQYYITENNEFFDISDKNMYLIARKYEPIDKKEATILATEILLTQSASVFAPGVDILYFFTKGAIKREKHSNWFKAGVSNAYENSICWFWLKGKPIPINKDDLIKWEGIDEEEAMQLKTEIDKRKEKESIKTDVSLMKKELKRKRAAYKKGLKVKSETLIHKTIKDITNEDSIYDLTLYNDGKIEVQE